MMAPRISPAVWQGFPKAKLLTPRRGQFPAEVGTSAAHKIVYGGFQIKPSYHEDPAQKAT